ncbi:MAG TPA: M20/M25/M40 family metallo-hydrolase [Vicinamibacterales bacterium]|nr:M20/M25/M40 family metallo-hydrolase [Vicinamibacterales bacterium]
MKTIAVALCAALAGAGAVALTAQTAEPVDAAINTRIRDEGLNRSRVQAVFNQFVDVIGARLTGSPEHKRAAEYARDELAKWGLSNARLEPFEFGRGWTLEKFTLDMVEPRYMPLVGYPEAWSPSTRGEIVASVVSLAGKTPEDVEATQASLKGAAIITQPLVTNFIRADRAQPTEQPDPPPAAAGGRGEGAGRRGAPAAQTPQQRIDAAIRAGGAGVLLRPSRGEHGTLFLAGGRDNPNDPLPKVVLIGEHYNMIARFLERGVPVKLRVNVQARFLDADRNTYNVLAEIPGVDPVLKDEVVMLGAHLDSWHTATGATDNADGSAAAMEAFRILKAIGAQPRRTLRLALWSGEEQGLRGSAAYVAKHLAGDTNAAARDKLTVYFNIDPGKGPIYGWFLEGNTAAKPIFDAWLAPFVDKEIGARRNVIQGIGSTDHLSFTRQNMLGFNPIQDFVGYDVREHHTNVDTADRIKEQDLKQSAIILASFVYHAAMRAQRIPRAAQ